MKHNNKIVNDHSREEQPRVAEYATITVDLGASEIL